MGIEIGEGRAVIACVECGKVIGVYYNAKKEQELLNDCFCLKCHNEGCDENK